MCTRPSLTFASCATARFGLLAHLCAMPAPFSRAFSSHCPHDLFLWYEALARAFLARDEASCAFSCTSVREAALMPLVSQVAHARASVPTFWA